MSRTPTRHLVEMMSSKTWVVIAEDPGNDELCSELEAHLHEAGLSTARVTVAPGTPAVEAVALLHAAADDLRSRLGADLAIQYSGLGRSAPAAMAAAAAERAGSVVWRPAWRTLGSAPTAAAPSLVVVHLDESRRARRSARRVARQSGELARLAVLWAGADPAAQLRGGSTRSEQACGGLP